TATGTPTRAAATPSMTSWGVVPRPRARTEASWITGPSIIGSENGMPTSTASAPAATTAWSTSTQSSVIPPIRYGTSSLPPASRFARSSFSMPISPSGAPTPASPVARGPNPGPSVCSCALPGARPEEVADLGDVLVAAAGQGDEDGGPGRQERAAGFAGHPGDGVGGLEGGDDPLGDGQQAERPDNLVVTGLVVGGPADGGQMGVLGADARVVEAGGDGLGLEDLPGLVL